MSNKQVISIKSDI